MKVNELHRTELLCSKLLESLDELQCNLNDKQSEILDNSYAGILHQHESDGLELLRETYQETITFWKHIEEFEKAINRLENFNL